MNKNYADVANTHFLQGDVLMRFLEYMRLRWADTETQKSIDGYADEWAERFKNGIEYECSDSIGRGFLDMLYAKKNEPLRK